MCKQKGLNIVPMYSSVLHVNVSYAYHKFNLLENVCELIFDGFYLDL